MYAPGSFGGLTGPQQQFELAGCLHRLSPLLLPLAYDDSRDTSVVFNSIVDSYQGLVTMLQKKLTDNLSGHWALLSGSQPNSEHCFSSKDVQIIYNCADKSWCDDREHYHTDSDEIYVVLEGAMHLVVNGNPVCIDEGEYLCVQRREKHQLLSVNVPHRSFVIRGPSIQDKVTT